LPLLKFQPSYFCHILQNLETNFFHFNIFEFHVKPRPALGQTKWVIWWQSGRNAKLNTYLHLAPKFKNDGAPIFGVSCTIMAYTCTTFPLHTIHHLWHIY